MQLPQHATVRWTAACVRLCKMSFDASLYPSVCAVAIAVTCAARSTYADRTHGGLKCRQQNIRPRSFLPVARSRPAHGGA
jgi:hypothetical protein